MHRCKPPYLREQDRDERLTEYGGLPDIRLRLANGRARKRRRPPPRPQPTLHTILSALRPILGERLDEALSGTCRRCNR